jgi:Uma2 family endonuclease
MEIQMSAAPKIPRTVEEYLEQERHSGVRHEFLDGEVFAMACASLRHAAIVLNIGVELRRQFRGKACAVYASDIRVGTPNGLYCYPDLVATCGQVQLRDQTSDTLLNPILLIEVLSESTKDYDRGSKFEQYRRIPSLKEYLTIAQDRVHSSLPITGIM